VNTTGRRCSNRQTRNLKSASPTAPFAQPASAGAHQLSINAPMQQVTPTASESIVAAARDRWINGGLYVPRRILDGRNETFQNFTFTPP
jgi:hypothetical protein